MRDIGLKFMHALSRLQQVCLAASCPWARRRGLTITLLQDTSPLSLTSVVSASGSTAHRAEPHPHDRTGVHAAQDTPRHSVTLRSARATDSPSRSPSCRDTQSTVAPCTSTHAPATRAPIQQIYTRAQGTKNLHAGPPIGGREAARRLLWLVAEGGELGSPSSRVGYDCT